MQIYNAIIVSQLTYGLNTLQLTPSMLARLDAFQMRGLRYILKIEHSFYSNISNESVYEKANIALNKGEDLNITWEEFIGANQLSKMRKIQKLSDTVMLRQGKLLGHLIKAPDNDCMKKTTINEDLTPKEGWRKRVGKPRLKWVTENCKYMYRNLEDAEFTHDNYFQNQMLIHHARERHF